MTNVASQELPDFAAAFRPGQVFRLDDEKAVASVTRLGQVDLPTGVVQVIDPLVYAEEPSSERAKLRSDAPVGAYDVELSASDGFPLAARVVFASEPVCEWESLEYSVSVDSGTIAFADDSLLPVIGTMSDDDLLYAVEAAGYPGGEVEVEQRPGFALSKGAHRTRIVTCSTGADGGYQCYWGIGGDGGKVCLVVDLGGLWVHPERGPRIPYRDLLHVGPIQDTELAAAGVSVEALEGTEEAISLKVDGYDLAHTWELRHGGNRIKHGKLFQRDKGVLNFSTPNNVPEGAYLFIGLPNAAVPMEPVDN